MAGKTGSNQWEVVTSKSNRHKQAANKHANNKKSGGAGDAKPTKTAAAAADITSVIKDTHTMFDALIQEDVKHSSKADKEKRDASSNRANAQNKAANGMVADGGGGKAKKNQSQSKKKGQDKKKAASAGPSGDHERLEDAIKELNSVDMQTLLTAIQSRFPDAPSIWLKDLSSYLNIKLPVEATDPVFSGHPFDYPLCLLPSAIRTILEDTLSQCSQQTLQLFFEHCLSSMAQNMAKGLPSLGDRIFLQCLAHKKPAIFVENIAKFVDLRSSYQNRHPICLSVLWAAGQAGVRDFKAGLQVWLELMLPVVGMRAFSKFAIEYLEDLLRLHPQVKCASDILGVREFFPILDFVFSSSGLPANSQKQMQELYPKLKALSYGPNPETMLRNYFPSYLRRLSTSHSPLRQELLSNLVMCLAEDRHCYSVWRQLYTKHLLQSSILMRHLSSEWDSLPANFPKKLLRETLRTFRVTNDELTSQGRMAQDGFADCVKYCGELLVRMNSWRFPWRHLVFLLFLGLNIWVVYDVHRSGSFHRSKTGIFLKETGLLAVCEQAWGKIKIYSNKAYLWLHNTIPVYYAWLCSLSGPYLQLFWSKLLEFCGQAWDASQGIRDWFNTNGPILLTWVSSFLLEMYEVIHTYALVAWDIIQKAGFVAVRWIQDNILTGSLSAENLHKQAGSALEAVQHYTLSAMDWFTQHVTRYASSSDKKGVP